MTTWSTGELATFLRATADDRLNPMWRLLATTGLRRGEALGLYWSDVDFDCRRLTIRRSRKQVGYAVLEENLKTDKPRSLPIDPGTVEALRRQAEMQLADQTEWRGAWVHDDHVSTREDGKPWQPDRITKLFDEAVESAGIKRIRLHDLPHTHATMALGAGVHPKVVSERLGHTSIAMTLDTYSHVILTLQDSAADLLGAMVDTALEAAQTDA
jgi:integrase